jgi:hypothetical protein
MSTTYPPLVLSPAAQARVNELAAQAGCTPAEAQHAINQLCWGIGDALWAMRNGTVMPESIVKQEEVAA